MGCCLSPDLGTLYTDLILRDWDKVLDRLEGRPPYGQFYPATMVTDDGRLKDKFLPHEKPNENGDTVITMCLHYIGPLRFCGKEVYYADGGLTMFPTRGIAYERENPTRAYWLLKDAFALHSPRPICQERSSVRGCYPLHYAFKLQELPWVEDLVAAHPEALSAKCLMDPLDDYDLFADGGERAPPAQGTPYELALFYAHRYQEGPEAVRWLLELLDYEGNPCRDAPPRDRDTWQHLVDHRAYDEVRGWLECDRFEDAFAFHWRPENMQATAASDRRFDELWHADLQGRTVLHACFRRGMSKEDVDLANRILDLATEDDLPGGGRNDLENMAFALDGRDMLPISLAARYCDDADLIVRIRDMCDRVLCDRHGRPFAGTPYDHMKDTLAERGWDGARAAEMLALLDFEGNGSRWEEPPRREIERE